VDHVVVVVVRDDTDLEEPTGFVWTDDHGEVGLVRHGDGGHGVLECVADVVVGDPALWALGRISTATTLVVVIHVGSGRERFGTGSAECQDRTANARHHADQINQAGLDGLALGPPSSRLRTLGTYLEPQRGGCLRGDHHELGAAWFVEPDATRVDEPGV
jgi:hypothetical protein